MSGTVVCDMPPLCMCRDKLIRGDANIYGTMYAFYVTKQVSLPLNFVHTP